MNYLDFLDDDDRGKIKLLMTLQLYSEQFLTKKKCIELTGLSKFLLDKYIVELNTECPELHISEENYDELAFRPVSNEVIQQLQYTYVQRSLRFRFFIEVLVEEKSIKKFQEEQHIGKTTLYQIRLKVLSMLKKERINVQKNQLVGQEAKARTIIFDIVSYFYFGQTYPFSQENEKHAQQLLQQITNYFNLDLTFLQRKKLILFLHIIQIRVKNRHTLKETYYALNQQTQQTFRPQLVQLEKTLNASKEADLKQLEESNYVLLFLFVSDMLPPDLDFGTDALTEIQETTQQLMNLLSKAIQVSDEQKEKLTDAFFKKLLGLSIFKQSYTTFIDTSAYNYFSEIYFNVHKLLLRFVRKNNFVVSLDLSNEDQAKMYYDLMFSILTYADPSQLAKPINIYIDFSHGLAYTEYISQSLQRFRDLNITIQKKFNNDTHLFLSDYRIKEVTCQQIIWKQPPTPSDWAAFADLVIELRETENEKNEIF